MNAILCRDIVKDLNTSLAKLENISQKVPVRATIIPNRTKEYTASSEHDLQIVISTLNALIKNVDRLACHATRSRLVQEVPLFTMMNDQLFSQKRFRDAITRIMSDYYDSIQRKSVSKRDPKIMFAGKLMESLMSHIREASNSPLLSEDERFSHTIVLIKTNNILRLKDLEISKSDVYHDFSIEHDSEQTESSIVNHRAFVNKTKETNRIATHQLKELRQIRSNINSTRIALEYFAKNFTKLLYIRLEFAGFWRAALANDEYGYAVDAYHEKCTREFKYFEKYTDHFSRMISKLREAEKLLSQAEKTTNNSSDLALKRVYGIDASVRELLPLLSAICMRSIGSRYEILIGEPNLRKYRELQTKPPALSSDSTQIASSSVSRKKSVFNSKQSSAKRQGATKLSRVAEIFGLEFAEEFKKRGSKQLKSHSSTHQDIVDEYDISMSQTLAVLEGREID